MIPRGRVIVVGGGAAGLMAAGRAAELGAEVLLLEKTRRVGKKLRITGKGRCNLTNACDVATFIGHLRPDGSFLRNALARFFAPELIAFFEEHGVPTVVERGNRVFPASGRAGDVVEALKRYCLDQGVQLRYRRPVDGILVEEGAVCGVRCGQETEPATQVILATGGLSYPLTGSTGDGYRLAQRLGHTVTPLRPGLVPLETTDPFIPRLQGLTLKNVRATMYRGDEMLASEFGELLFTHFGLSGPIILTLSSRVSEALALGPLQCRIDLKPALDEATLDARLQRELASLGKGSYHALLRRLLPRSLVPVFAERSGIATTQRLDQFTAAQRRCVLELLKRFDVTVSATRPIDEAIITLGGVPCNEVDPQTMASRRVRGLYLAGELLDIAGDTGGYNLQIAFTTGRIAGESAAEGARRL